MPQIARSLGLELRPLYRRLHTILASLRNRLARHDIDSQEIARAVGHPARSLHRVREDAGRNV